MREDRDTHQSCGCCRYWEPPPETHGAFGDTGQCRFTAPRSEPKKFGEEYKAEDGPAHTLYTTNDWWPRSRATDWCGEWAKGKKWTPPERRSEFTKPLGETP